jgi:transcriptional regulator with XRE-family HTH domain
MGDLFAKRLTVALAEDPRPQGEIAVAVGISAGTLSNWKRGRFEPDVSDFCALADQLGVGLAWLAGRGERPERDADQELLERLGQLSLVRTLEQVQQAAPDLLEVLRAAEQKFGGRRRR